MDEELEKQLKLYMAAIDYDGPVPTTERLAYDFLCMLPSIHSCTIYERLDWDIVQHIIKLGDTFWEIMKCKPHSEMDPEEFGYILDYHIIQVYPSPVTIMRYLPVKDKHG